MALPSSRLTYGAGLLAIVVVLAVIVYLQVFMGFNPCPLCILQRFMLMLLGLVFFIGAAVHFKKRGYLLISLTGFIISCCGALLAARQVWLQTLPVGQSSGCGASLEYMLQVMPFTEVLQKIFGSSADCSQEGMKFLNLSLAGWSGLFFAVMIGLTLWEFCRALSKSRG